MEPRGALRVQLGRAPLDRGVNILVGVGEDELAALDLAPDLDQRPLQPGELRLAEKAGLDQAAGMGDAAGDVVGRQLEVDLERAREPLQLRQERILETPSPQLSLAQGASLFTSPRRPARSRVWSWPWTCEAVRTPWPQSLMKPAAADWSKASPLPYVASDSW